MALRASDYPALPYPGARPSFSYVLDDDEVLDTSGVRDLDAWLRARGLPTLDERVPVLSYGSNACPSKLLGLELPGPVVMTLCTTQGLSAVWCNGWRQYDGSRVATLAAVHDGEESHFVLWATAEQGLLLDACEGRAHSFYELIRLEDGAVRDSRGTVVPGVYAYVGGCEARFPRQDDGYARRVLDESAVAVLPVTGQRCALPEPWQQLVFVYGTLMPGECRWSSLEPFVQACSEDRTRGALLDTGYGFPGLLLDDGADVEGVTVTLDPETAGEALRVLDQIEGVEGGLYRRVRVVTGAGRLAWTYEFLQPTADMRRVPGRWRPEPTDR